MEATTEEYRGYQIKISYDEICESPRDWDNSGVMVMSHKRYNLPEESESVNFDSFYSWEEVYNYIRKELKAKIILPVYMYDHSGVALKVGSFQGLLSQGHAEFDSGQVGFIYMTAEAIRENWQVKRISKKLLDRVEKNLEAEVELYGSYLNGEVFLYNIKKGDEDIDLCAGFYGYDHEKSGLMEYAKNAIDYDIKSRKEDREKALKALIKNKVPVELRKERLENA